MLLLPVDNDRRYCSFIFIRGNIPFAASFVILVKNPMKPIQHCISSNAKNVVNKDI